VLGDSSKVSKRAPVGVDPFEIDAECRAMGGSRAGDGPRVLRGKKRIEREATAPRQIEARRDIRGGNSRAAERGGGKHWLAGRAGLEWHARGRDPESLPEEPAKEPAAHDKPVTIDSVAKSLRPRLLVGGERRGKDDRSPGIAVGEVEGDGRRSG
jgi:hypothetical protein